MVNTASSILVLLKHGDQEASVLSAIGDGKVLWSGADGLDWIGKEDEKWDSVFLIEYQSFIEVEESAERFREKNFENIRLFSVRPISKMRIRMFRFLMKYIFSRSSVELIGDTLNWDMIPQSDILPTKDQHLRVAKEKKDGPIVMVNFLSFYDAPKYPSGFTGKRAKSGELAYGQYGRHVMRTVAKLGGIIEYAGEVESLLIGESDVKWNQFGFMRYHTLDALQGMFRAKENIGAGIHRDAGLKVTEVMAFSPID